MTFLGAMVALLLGSVLIRTLVNRTGVAVAQRTDSTGCGCLAALLVLALVAILAGLL